MKRTKNNHFIIYFLLSFLALGFVFILSISLGQVKINFTDVISLISNKIFNSNFSISNMANEDMYKSIIFDIRIKRALLSILVGMGLSLCGVIMQATLKNPLADPYILGISSGASLGATFAIMISSITVITVNSLGISFFAFAGAFIAGYLVLLMASHKGKLSTVKLILAGTIINSIATSLSNLLIYISGNSEKIKDITFWTMGSLAKANKENLILISVLLFFAAIFFITQHRNLNAMLMDEEVTQTLGVNINVYRKVYIFICILLIGVIVSSSGIIGFVGLTVPHIVRALVGSDHKKLVPLSMLFGGIFLSLSDILSRILINNTELPIGIITALIGGPVFIYILLKRGNRFGG
ncbi:MAG: iron ABC transporter permease [Peptostreptococcus sp.]|uniref:FecCD family ABC transporter permease n=1 Tax=Peptostreptococcus sp. TaxID=1262 RepID=UPI002FCC2DFA